MGIAEQHAVTLSAGMATEGMIVYCTIYSTFLQRAYDQIIHDVALQNLPVIFCLDRAGLVGQDGATHHGAFDLAYLNCIPNLIIYAPSDEVQLRNMLYTVQLGIKHPIAIRYPRGRGVCIDWKQAFDTIPFGKSTCIQKGDTIAILTIGTIIHNVLEAITQISEPIGIYDFAFLKPLDTHQLDLIFKTYDHIITVEDGTIIGGLGSSIADYAFAKAYKGSLTTLGLPDRFINHGTVDELQEEVGIDVNHIRSTIEKIQKKAGRL